ncbi:hypothetical protein BJ165DRAFT_1553674 [Panaeolus papilionaceus]|nr:hypothetical protein BJ165DRAFT_1553674 [Panaeolus papilionaceus]
MKYKPKKRVLTKYDSWTTIEDSQEGSEDEAKGRNVVHDTETDPGSSNSDHNSCTDSISNETTSTSLDEDASPFGSEDEDVRSRTKEDSEYSDTSTGTYIPDPEWKALIARRGGRQWIKTQAESAQPVAEKQQDEGGDEYKATSQAGADTDGGEVGQATPRLVMRNGVVDVAREVKLGGDEKIEDAKNQKRGRKRKAARKCDNCGSEVSRSCVTTPDL